MKESIKWVPITCEFEYKPRQLFHVLSHGNHISIHFKWKMSYLEARKTLLKGTRVGDLIRCGGNDRSLPRKGRSLHEATPACWWMHMKIAFIFHGDHAIGAPCLLITLFEIKVFSWSLKRIFLVWHKGKRVKEYLHPKVMKKEFAVTRFIK